MAAAFPITVTLLAKTLYDSYGQKRETDQMLSLYEDEGNTENDVGADDWSRGLSEINSDYAGWLTVFGTQANYAVVQGKDNS